jgi:hypothetical protein
MPRKRLRLFSALPANLKLMMRLHPIALIFSIFVAAACPASAGSHTMNAEEMKLFRLVTNDREQLRPEAKLDRSCAGWRGNAPQTWCAAIISVT